MTLKVIGMATDHRTSTPVIYCQSSIPSYLALVGTEFENFAIQRRRETHKAYGRLKEDTRHGALLPSITLAVKPEFVSEIIPLLDKPKELGDALSNVGRADILDGLQRTYIMKDLKDEGHDFVDQQTVLLEFWIESDIQKLIYRIIVLNAGQKPMSIRHQIELLFMSLRTTIEKKVPDLQIYTERDATRRRRARKFPLSFVVSGYQSFMTSSSELQKENLIANKMQADTLFNSSEGEISEKFEQFIRFLTMYAEYDDQVFRIYQGLDDEALPDPISGSEPSTSEAMGRNIHWLATENLFISFFAALSQHLKSDYVANLEIKARRLDDALSALNEMLRSALPGSDPFAIDTFDRLRLGTNPRRVNVGAATRKLLSNGFKEYFRSGGEMPFSQCWQLGAD